MLGVDRNQRVRVTQSLVAYANGSGGVTVYGNPAQRSVSGKRVTVMN